MSKDKELSELLHSGGVYFNVPGKNSKEVYKILADTLPLPATISADVFYKELCEREDLMSTGVGNGIAIPHPRYPILKDTADERLFVCYLDTPFGMNGIDNRPVYVMFILLTSNSKSHLKVLSQLAFLFQKQEFRTVLEKKPIEADLLSNIDAILK